MSERQFRPAWRGFYLHFLSIILCLAVAAVVSVKWLPDDYQQWLWRVTAAVVVYIVCSMLYKRNSLLLVVRPDKISLESGFIGRHSVEISAGKVSTIQVKQSIMQRILNVGDIRMASSGTDEYEITAANMPNPHEIREAIHSTEKGGQTGKADKEEPSKGE